MVDTTNEWIMDRVGIRERHIVDKGVAASDLAVAAVKKVLVLGSDVNSSMTDYTDRAVCIIFGDGAGAVLLEASHEDGIGVIDHVAQIEGLGGQYLFMPGGGSLNPATHETVDQKMHYIHQDGKNVFKYAVKKMSEMTERILERNHL